MLGIERAFDGEAAALEDVGVDHGGADILVPKKFLYGADVVAVLKEVGGKGMAEGVGADAFLDACFLGGFFDGALEASFVYMVAAFCAGARVDGALGGGEEVLPGKFAVGFRVFFVQCAGKVDLSEAGGQVFLMVEANLFDLALEGEGEGVGEGGDAVFFAFAITDGDGFVLEVDVFDAQADTFHEAQARAVEDLGHEFEDAVHVVDHVQSFFAGEDGGEAFGAFGG